MTLAACFAVFLAVPSLSGGVAFADSDSATISGTAYDAAGAAITTGDVCAYAYAADTGDEYGPAETSGTGAYAISGLPADSYYVYFEDCGSSSRNDVSQYYVTPSGTPSSTSYTGTPYEDDATEVTVADGGSQTGIDATLATGATISGTVYGGSTSNPLDAACVDIESDEYGNSDYYEYYDETGADGSYSIGHVQPGVAYTAEFYPCDGTTQYADEYYDGKFGYNNANTITPTAGQTLAGIDATLPAAASISGTVYDASGATITDQDVCVNAYPTGHNDGGGYAQTDSSGDYTITGLDPGSYNVYFNDCDGDRNDVSQYYLTPSGTPTSTSYSGTLYEDDAATVTLAAGATQGSIDATLAAGQTISGYVYGDSTSNPLDGACVDATNGSDNDYLDFSASTGSDGSYTITNLPASLAYTVEFQACGSDSSYATQFYDGASNPANATTITPPQTGIDATLSDGASISGTVYDASGTAITSQDVCVEADSTSGDGSYAGAQSDSSGDYTITGLDPGSYYVEFYDCPDSTRNDVAQYYLAPSGTPTSTSYTGAPEQEASTPVVLSTGGSQTGVDATLAAGVTITGTVYGGASNSTPADEIDIYAYSVSSSVDGYGYAETDASGDYTIGHLPYDPEGYDVEFSDNNQPATYLDTYYDTAASGDAGTNDSSTATPVIPAADSTATANIHLTAGGSITGQLIDSSGNEISSDVCLEADLDSGGGVYTYYYGYDDSGETRNGTYTIGGLPPGDYSVYASDCDDSRNDVNQSISSDVTVTAGGTTTVNFQMQPATTISGTVEGCSHEGTSLSNGQIVYGCTGTQTPLANVCVEAYTHDYDSDEEVETTADGSYTLDHIVPGDSYTVHFYPCNGSQSPTAGYEPEYYDNVTSSSLATKLTPTLSEPATNVNASLPYGAPVATITGGPANSAATSATSANFSFKANVDGATFRCKLDSGSYRSCTSPYSTGTLATGTHTFSVEAVSGGKTETSPPTVTWTINPASSTSTSQGQVAAGQTFSSDPGATPSSTVPVVVSVTLPDSSQVTLTTEPTTTASPNGYTIVGEQVDISAANPDGSGTVTGTAGQPIMLDFALDPSQIPAGTNIDSLTVTRDGTPAANCTTSGVADPDPCVESRSTAPDGTVSLVVLTTHCSTWNFAVATPTAPTSPTSPTAPTSPTSPTAPTSPTSPTAPSTGTQPSPGGTQASVPSRARVLAALRSLLAPRGKTATAASVLKKGYAFTFKAPSAGRLVVDWYYLPAGARLPKALAHKTRKKPKPKLVASTRVSVSRAGSRKVTVKLNRTGRRLLRHASRLKLTTYATFTPRGGKLVSATKHFTLKR